VRVCVVDCAHRRSLAPRALAAPCSLLRTAAPRFTCQASLGGGMRALAPSAARARCAPRAVTTAVAPAAARLPRRRARCARAALPPPQRAADALHVRARRPAPAPRRRRLATRAAARPAAAAADAAEDPDAALPRRARDAIDLGLQAYAEARPSRALARTARTRRTPLRPSTPHTPLTPRRTLRR
jgi:hypothetical protein